HFQRSHIVEVPLGLAAASLAEFRAGLARVDESAIYLHSVETRVRAGRAEAFTTWLGDALGIPELADRFERVDPYLTTLERGRGRLRGFGDGARGAGRGGAGSTTTAGSPGRARSISCCGSPSRSRAVACCT